MTDEEQKNKQVKLQAEHEEFMWNNMSIKDINNIQEVLKPLGYMIIGFREKRRTPIVLYLKKI